MKRFLVSSVGCLVAFAVVDVALAAPTTSRGGRIGMQQQNVMSARMPSIPVTAVGVTTSVSNVVENPVVVEPEAKEEEEEQKEPEQPSKDMREKEREACIRNNIGIGNTFVWASRYSDINNYATMVEDTEEPENNTCFVRVGLKSSDSRIDLSDIPGKYFEMGRNITCGSWVDEDKIEKRILDAKKNARTWATVGGAVGGAAIGVTSMELFGNKLIGGKVEGQKDKNLDRKQQFRSYLLSLSDSERQSLIGYFAEMDEACKNLESKPDACKGVDVGDGLYYGYGELRNITKK